MISIFLFYECDNMFDGIDVQTPIISSFNICISDAKGEKIVIFINPWNIFFF